MDIQDTITKCLDLLRKKKTKKRFAFVTEIFEKEDKDKKEVICEL